MRRREQRARHETDPFLSLAILDRGEHARDGRFVVRIGEQDWHSEHRVLLERLLASVQGNGATDARR